MGFRVRLALFLVAILASVQGLTWLAVYEVTRRQSIAEGERQLAAAADALVAQLDDIATRVAGSVQVLALDYPLRAAIAGHDDATVLSVLRNHGRRVGAERMLLLDLDGRITADTARQPDAATAARAFPFPDLLNAAFDAPATAVVAIDGSAYWMIVVPVYAPQPVALIAAGIPLDDRLLSNMQKLSALPNSIELLASHGGGPWSVVAQARAQPAIARVLAQRDALPAESTLVGVDAREFVALVRPLRRVAGDVRMAAVIGYSVDDALRPFRMVSATWGLLVAIGLVVGVGGVLAIARGMSRPLEALAEAASRIEAGDYTALPPSTRRDELGHLAAVFTQMTTAIREREAHIRYQGEHDAVTGLPNRRAAERTIEQHLQAPALERGALLTIGLARLPDIVKTMGHALSDRLMADAAARLRTRALGQLVSRATDSQFVVWLPGVGRNDAVATAFRIRDVLGEPYREGDLALDLAPAVGVALHPEHGTTHAALMQHGDVALFTALRQEEPVAIYDPAADPHRPDLLALMSDLRVALDGSGLEIHYQPKLTIASGLIEGAEGLVRWTHSTRGRIAPDDFIPLAEKTGNIRRLTRWLLDAGIAQAQHWANEQRRVRLAFNLSARDLDDTSLPRRVANLLSAHDLGADRVMLEVTESAVMGEPDAAIQVLRRLADQGIDIAIDDFGVGQSSLAYLRRLPVRELKIDKSFVRNLATDMEDRTIVRSIVDLAHRLGFRVTSEGVEDRAALDYLAEVGCDYAQGYHIARPLPVQDFERFLDQPRRQAAGG